MKNSAIAFFLALATLFCASPAFAKKHATMPVCKGATVYAVSATKVYYMRGSAQFGHVKGGTYMCQAAANAKGYHSAGSSMNAKMRTMTSPTPKPH